MRSLRSEPRKWSPKATQRVVHSLGGAQPQALSLCDTTLEVNTDELIHDWEEKCG